MSNKNSTISPNLKPIYAIRRGVLVIYPLSRMHITGRIEEIRREERGEEVVEKIERLPKATLSSGVEVPIIPFNTINGCTKLGLFIYTLQKFLAKRGYKGGDVEFAYEKLLLEDPPLAVLMTLKIPFLKPYFKDLEFKISVYMNPYLSIYSFGIGKRVIAYSDAYPVAQNLTASKEIASRAKLLEQLNRRLVDEGFEPIQIPQVVTNLTELSFMTRKRVDVSKGTEDSVVKFFVERFGLSEDVVREAPFIKSVVWQREFLIAHTPYVSPLRVKVTHPLTISHLGALVASIISLPVLGRESNQFQVHLVCIVDDLEKRKDQLLYVMKDSVTNDVTMNEFAKNALKEYDAYVMSDHFEQTLRRVAEYVFSKS